MIFRLLKRFVPRGLFGRAALILVVPVVTVQVVVSVVFVQRHFDRVTAQMTRTMAIPLGHFLEELGAAPDPAAVARDLGGDLGLEATFPAGPVAARRLPWDLSGRSVVQTLAEVLPQVAAVDLSQSDRVLLLVPTARGPVAVQFPRARVTPANPHQLLVLMAATGILMTLVAYVFLRNQLRPITRLAEAAEAFGRGRLVPYRPRGATEVRAAGAAFLDMRARLERARDQRTLLLSGVSHDLRTPLTRLRLELSMRDDADATAMLGDVAEMERMIDDFLDFARGEAEEGRVEPVSPAELACRIVDKARRAGRTVALHLGPDTDTPVALRPGAVERAVDNLVQNALRYGTVVALRVAAGADWLRFSVEDDGPGIPPERREEAMRPFVRLDAARNRDRGGGSGLGLAIALDVARMHGGSLRLGQSPVLGGLMAEFVLPR
jgi:two-component system, OmpR family, osmolarity sensor histidine kinase EnvZ